jgi:outer membrane protein OmpA-like peptidoglycan-associated protein
MLLLPDGVSYQAGTLQLDGAGVVDPRVMGPSLTISLADQFGVWDREVRFTADISPEIHGQLTTRAFARFDSASEIGQKTPIVETSMAREQAIEENEDYVLKLRFDVMSAELSADDRMQLAQLITDWRGVRDIHITAVGHSDSTPIKAVNRHIFADNYLLSRARARSAAIFLADALGVPMENVEVEGRGPDDPLDTNETAAGRQNNRRVEMVLSGLRSTRPSFLDVTQARSGTVVTQTKGAIPGAAQDTLQARIDAIRDDESGMPSSQVEPDVGTLAPAFAMLLPAEDFQPAIPATKISIQHAPTDRVAVYLNEEPVNALNFVGTVTNAENTVAISRWHGVDLEDGLNVIRVEQLDGEGAVIDALERYINYSGAAIRAEVVPDMSVLVADGKTRPVIAVRLFDRSGKPARKGTAGVYRVESPYRSWWEVEKDRKNAIVDIHNREPTYRVGPEGIAYIELEPTTHTGEVVMNLKFQYQRQQELRTWLSAEPRDWILVGFAEGTAGYNTLADNVDAAMNAGLQDGYYDDGRVAFFAKGQVRGDYLLTLSYDSARDRDTSRHQFQTQVDPNAYYAIYADNSEQRFEAASQRKLYVKLERKQFYALFGDFNTGLSFTELSRYERRFNGLKSGYRGRNVGYTVFAAETDQSFVRDELRGDGTSGLYLLSSAPIIGNSETIRIEVRDRFDSGRVLSSDTLTRFLDYNLDVLDGSVYFKRPIPSRDQQFNPVFIVAEYESLSDANEDVVAGGRGSLRFSEDAVEVGLTHINDGQQGAEGELTGVDLRWQINAETLFRAESASSNKSVAGSKLSGSAHALYLEHNSEKVDLQAYIKEVEDEFGLGQQSAAESGIRRLGIEGRAQVSERFFFDGNASWQQNLSTDAIRSTMRAQVRYENNGFSGTSGIVRAKDEFADGEVHESNLAELGASHKLFNGKLNLRANGSLEMASQAESLDYPARYVIGADYRLSDGVELFGEYEDATGRDIEATMTRVGVRASPWARAQINSSLSSNATEFGPRVFANVGMVQGFQLTDNWVFDIGYDQTSTILDADARQFDPDRELASGSLNDDFQAIYTGATYSGELWSANGRIEHRRSDVEQRYGLIAGWYREALAGHGMSAGLTLFTTDTAVGTQSSLANLKYGWAYRKADGRWSFLNRIDLVLEDIGLTDRKQTNRRIINNLNANRRFSHNTQLSLQYAFKYVLSDFDGLRLSGYTDLIGVDYRRGFKGKWDVGLHTSVYHSYRSKTFDHGTGLDLGYNLLDNMWLTLGYNFTGFVDADFSAARYTAQGPFLRISIKADQHTLKQIAGQR